MSDKPSFPSSREMIGTLCPSCNAEIVHVLMTPAPEVVESYKRSDLTKLKLRVYEKVKASSRPEEWKNSMMKLLTDPGTVIDPSVAEVIEGSLIDVKEDPKKPE